jgi:hypothetical protein
MLRKSLYLAIFFLVTIGGSVEAAETVDIEPSADATLYGEGSSLANGAGAFFFTGRTDNGNGAVERRALVAFDIAGSVPAGATITEVSLELTMSRTISGAQTVNLHRVLEGWSEGPSDPTGQEGGGAASGAGDATWIHREFPNDNWMMPGGSFTGTVSSSQQVSANGDYTFASTAQMVADVQSWLDDPDDNFGWELVIPSPGVASAKRFNSRENTNASSRPMLSVTYEADGGSELGERYVFPASNAGGSGGSFFITTVDVVNGGSTSASFRVQLLPRNTDNSSALESALFTLEPGEVRRFNNILGEAFGSAGEDVAGGAAILSDSDELVVMSRTFNQVDEGTIGAALPGVSNAELIQAGDRVKVVFLTETGDFRSNLGLINGVGIPITVQWELFDAAGNSLGVDSEDLDPFGVTQINRVMRPFRPIEGGYAVVWTDTAGGAFTTYGSVLDQGTSDPTLVIPK